MNKLYYALPRNDKLIDWLAFSTCRALCESEDV